MKEERKSEKKLNDKQQKLLRMIAEYRFMTAGALAALEGRSHHASSHARLEALRAAGYVERHFTPKDRLIHKPARYYLGLPGIRKIKSLDKYGDRLVKTLYNDASASDRFIDHSLAVVSVAAAFRRLYGEKRTVYPRSILMADQFDYFPRPEPDAYISLKHTETILPSPFAFLDYYEDSVLVGIHGRKIRRYISYVDDGIWGASGKPLPVILLVCESARLAKALTRRTKYIASMEYADVSFRITTLERLQQATTEQECGWIDPEADE